MISPLDTNNPCHFSSLPNECLLYIFYQLDHWKTKVKLQTVCRRFNECCFDPKAWENYLNMVPESCTDYPIGINGIMLPVQRWPRAINHLLERMQVEKMVVTLPKGHDQWTNTSDWYWEILSVFWLRKSQVQLKSLTVLQYGSNCGRELVNWLLSHCCDKIQSLNLGFFHPGVHTKLERSCWAFVNQCHSLSDFTVGGRLATEFMSRALENKKLLKLSLSNMQISAETVVHLCNGTRKLRLDGLTGFDLSQFCTSFNGDNVERLKELSLRQIEINGRSLEAVFATFPNLRDLCIDRFDASHVKAVKIVLMVADIIKSAANREPHHTNVRFERMNISAEKEDFWETLTLLKAGGGDVKLEQIEWNKEFKASRDHCTVVIKFDN